MKKVSTVAAKQGIKIVEQKLTVGLDLDDRSSWYCVVDESGAVVLEQRLSTTAKQVAAPAETRTPNLHRATIAH